MLCLIWLVLINRKICQDGRCLAGMGYKSEALCVNQRDGRGESLSLLVTILCPVFRLWVLNKTESDSRTKVLQR
jgi:hypothetical protein